MRSNKLQTPDQEVVSNSSVHPTLRHGQITTTTAKAGKGKGEGGCCQAREPNRISRPQTNGEWARHAPESLLMLLLGLRGNVIVHSIHQYINTSSHQSIKINPPTAEFTEHRRAGKRERESTLDTSTNGRTGGGVGGRSMPATE
jgi:hypothetical protein